jgi:hypothetical protein
MNHMDYVTGADRNGPLRIGKGTGTIGPAHDPYSTETLEVVRGDKTAEWYFNGLGMDRLRLYDKQDGKDVLVREINWSSTSNDRASRLQTFKARLLFKQWVGVASDDAEELFYANYEPDPMGHPSRYE